MKRLSIVICAGFVLAAVSAFGQSPDRYAEATRHSPSAAASQKSAAPKISAQRAPLRVAQREEKPAPVETKAPAARPAQSADYPQYPNLSPGELQATPEMWFYEQSMRQYMDPKMAVRQAAEFRAEQRQRRLESMKWFGLSNQRPRSSADPLHNDNSPRWTGNNDYYPDRWSGVSGGPVVVERSDATRTY